MRTLPLMDGSGGIEAVTVFREGALIRRRVMVSAGTTTLRVGPLPLVLEDESLRARGDGGVLVREARVVLAPVDAADAKEPPEDAELKTARTRELEAEGRVEATRRAIAAIESVPLHPRAHARDEAPGPIPVDARLALSRFRRERLERLATVLAEQDEALREARNERAHLEARRKAASSARRLRAGALRKAVDLTLEAANDGALTLEYIVTGARWTPSYVLRFDEELKHVELRVRALVAQRTHEDWSDVALTLSTATLQRWTELPELAAIRIGRRQAAPPRAGWRPPPSGVEALFEDFDRAKPGAPPEPQAAPPPPAKPKPPPTDEMLMDLEPLSGAAPPAPGGAAIPSAPMPPQSAPMPVMQAAPMPEARKSGGVLSGLFGSSGGGGGVPPAASAPPRGGAPKGSRARRSSPKKKRRKEALADEPETELDAELEAGALLAYGRLRLPGAKHARRGRLRLLTRVEVYAEVLEDAGYEIGFDLRGAVRAAREPSLDPLPKRHRWPTDVDGFDYAYRALAKVDVPSDGSFRGVPVHRSEGRAEPRFVTVPRESSDVFREVATPNLVDAPLLPGPVDVYVGDEYLLTRDLPLVPVGGTLRLGLGVEQRLKVARNSRYDEETTGLLRGSRELHHEVTIELGNHLAREALVEVRERLPTLREDEDEIEIRVDSVKPTWSSWDPDDHDLKGGHRWEVRVPAGGETTLELSYTIRIGSKHELVGGNRREGS